MSAQSFITWIDRMVNHKTLAKPPPMIFVFHSMLMERCYFRNLSKTEVTDHPTSYMVSCFWRYVVKIWALRIL